MAGQTTRDVLINIRLQMQGSKLPAPDTTAVDQTISRVRRDVQQAYVNLDLHAQAQRDQLQEFDTLRQKASPTQNATDSNVVGKMRIAADAYKVAMEGALHLARGLAFLTATGEEELQVVLRRIAYYQGLTDIFRGGVDLIKGTVVGTRSLVAAHTAAAAATAAHSRFAAGHAAPLALSTQAMNVASAAATRLWTAMTGPIGWAALAGGIVYGAVAWTRYSRAVEDAEIKQLRMLKEQAILTSMAKGRQDELNRSVEMGARLRESASLRAATTALDLGMMGGMPKVALGATEEQRRNADRAAQRATYLEKVNALSRAAAEQQASAARHLAEIMPRSTVMTVESKQQELEAARARADGLKAGIDFQKQHLQLMTEERNAIQGLIRAEHERFSAQKAAFKEEENRKKTMLQRFGEMSQGEQQQILALSRKVKAGGIDALNPDEIGRLRQSGFADNILSHRDLRVGLAAGGEELQRNLGFGLPGTTDQAEGQGANQTRSDFIKQQMEQTSRATKDLERLHKEQSDERSRLWDTITKNMEEVAKIEGDTLRNLEKVIASLVEVARTAAAKTQQAGDNLNRIRADLVEEQMGRR